MAFRLHMAARKQTELTWYGHSAFRITTPAGNVLLIDPWIRNPTNSNGDRDVSALDRVDLIFLTHGHFDHVGDAVEIGKRTGAKLVANFDLATAMVKALGYPAEQADMDTVGHFGGNFPLLDGDVTVTFVRSHHGSGMTEDEEHRPFYAGSPGGFVISIKGGPTFYHTGDTDLFSDMSWIAAFHRVDVMLTCMGDHFTMGPARAAEAVKLVKARKTIPMHFGTFPVLTGTPAEFKKELQQRGSDSVMQEMKIGETIQMSGS